MLRVGFPDPIGGDLGEILLPGRYIPPGLKQGGKIDVFIYLDSDDRLVATTERPLAPSISVAKFASVTAIVFDIVHSSAGIQPLLASD